MRVVIGGSLNDPQLPKTWGVFVFRHFWVHFCPSYGGSRWILMSRGFRICMAKGDGESKMPGCGRLSISPFPIAGDWLKVAHNQAFLTPYPPLPYIFWTLWTWGFTGTACTWGKNASRNAWKRILLRCWAIVDHSGVECVKLLIALGLLCLWQCFCT